MDGGATSAGGGGADAPPSHLLRAALPAIAAACPGAFSGTVLDLACGGGRHALLLARRSLTVHALDRDSLAIARLAAAAAGEGLSIRAEVVDLEAPGFTLEPGAYSLIVVVNYLHRPLLATIERALAATAALYYETFTTGQRQFGRPVNPDYLLAPGELATAFPALRTVDYEEGVISGPAAKAWLVACRGEPD